MSGGVAVPCNDVSRCEEACFASVFVSSGFCCANLRRSICCFAGWMFQGVLLTGILKKSTLGTSANGLIHILMNDIGPDGARSFVDQVQRVVNHWLLQRGFSVGIGDAIARKETMEEISKTIAKSKDQVRELLAQAQVRGKQIVFLLSLLVRM